MRRTALFTRLLIVMGLGLALAGGLHLYGLRQEDLGEVAANWQRLGLAIALAAVFCLLAFGLFWRRRQREVNEAPRALVSLAPRRREPELAPAEYVCDFWRLAPAGYLPARSLELPGEHICMELGGDHGQMAFSLSATPDVLEDITPHVSGEWSGVAIRPLADSAAEIDPGRAGEVLVDVARRGAGVWRWRTFRLREDDASPLQVFARGYGEPLPRQLGNLLAGVGALPAGVVGGVQVLVRPAPGSWARRWQRRYDGLQRRLNNRGSHSSTQTHNAENGSSTRKATSRQFGPPDPAKLKRELAQLETRMQQTPLYEVAIRAWCAGDDEAQVERQAGRLAQTVVSATRGANELKIWQKGRDAAPVVGRHFPARGGFIMTAAELGQLMHLPRPDQIADYPRLHTAGAGHLGAEGRVLADAAGDEGQERRPDRRIYGVTTDDGGREAPVGQPFRDATMHTFIAGSTGSGKSVLAANLVLQDWLAGHSALVIDPHSSLIDDILRGVPAARQQDVLLLDPGDRRQPFRFNLFDVAGGGTAGAERLLAAIRIGMGASWESSVGMREVLWHAIMLTQLTAEQPSMAAMAALLHDEARVAALRRLTPVTPAARETLTFWRETFPSWTVPDRKRALNAARRRVETFTRRPLVRRALGMAGSTVDLAAALNAGKLVLCPMHAEMGHETKRIWSAVLMQQAIHTLMARRPGANLPRVTVALDELAESVGTLADDVTTLLNETRKYGAAVILLNQTYVNLPDAVRQVIIANCRTQVALNLGAEDARVAQEVLGPPVRADDVAQLPRYQGYARLIVDNTVTAPCRIHTLPPPQPEKLAPQPMPQPPAGIAAPWAPAPENPGAHLDEAELLAWARRTDPQQEADAARLLAVLTGLDEARYAALHRLWRQSDAWWTAQLLAQPALIAEVQGRLRVLSQQRYGIPWWWSDADYMRASAPPDARKGNGAARGRVPL